MVLRQCWRGTHHDSTAVVQRFFKLLRGAFPSESSPAWFWPLSFSRPAVLIIKTGRRVYSARESTMRSRRNFLKQMSGAVLAVGAAPFFLAKALASPQSGSIDMPGIDMPGEDGLIVRSF